MADIENKDITPIAQGETKRKKKSFGKKLASVFFETDLKSIREYITYELLVPTIKNTLSEIVNKSVNQMLYGNGDAGYSNHSSRNTDTPPRVSYDRYSRPNTQRQRLPDRRSVYDFDDIFFQTRDDAEEVLRAMKMHIERFKFVTVDDYYAMCHEVGDYNARYYGWVNLDSAYVSMERNGYTIRFPRCFQLDDVR